MIGRKGSVLTRPSGGVGKEFAQLQDGMYIVWNVAPSDILYSDLENPGRTCLYPGWRASALNPGVGIYDRRISL